MTILCTFPGRAGDLLWALPTVRAVSEHFRQPVDLQIAGEFAGMLPLLRQQPYLAGIHADETWGMDYGWDPPFFESGYDRAYHLGYHRWPELPLPFETAWQLGRQWDPGDGFLPPTDLARPWIHVEGPGIPIDIAVGFTEAWFELKLGVLASLGNARLADSLVQLTPPGTRWDSAETTAAASVYPCDWLDAARAIRNSDLFVGDCSALHVLACALGQRCVIIEPMEARHNGIFYPYGQDGPKVRLVRGLDGQPTFDARHAADTIREALRA